MRGRVRPSRIEDASTVVALRNPWQDPVSRVIDNARYPEAFNIQLPDVGHNMLLFSSRVYRLLLENLAAPLL